MIKEACVENLQEAKKAEEQGADQVELCGRLDLDGLTPDFKLVKDALLELKLHVKVMVRSRGGDFVYTEEEIEEMISTIEQLKALGVKEIVLGALTGDNQLDIPAITKLAVAAIPMKVTFHKAIDELDDPVEGVRQLRAIPGITGVLTSGGKLTAKEGVSVINQMHAAAESIQIIAAGKITNQNLLEMRQRLTTDAYHGKLIVGRLA
ncbi:MAG: copper homeostasis protein CutC [Reichenbachiella sp.]|uniref:copper homeostasis protein CutC n=1 Tax=Reichenbachiella sp. TaxID=2184521 RepID=UPI003267ED84